MSTNNKESPSFWERNIGFDLNFILEENKIKFYDWENIIIYLKNWDKIEMDLKKFIYKLYWKIYTFSPFYINLDMVDEKEIKEVFIPLFLKERFLKDLDEKITNKINESRKHFNSSVYNKITNTYE